MRALLVLTASLALQQSNPSSPPPRKAIAGLGGFEGHSTLTFPASPDRPHHLRTTYAFPNRVRWQLTVAGDKGGEHETRFRFGEHFYLQREGSRQSEECTAEDRAEMLLAMELRRALVTYPDGFEWKDSNGERRAGLGDAGAVIARPSSVADARPSEMRAVTRDGRSLDHYKSITWREQGGRSWPSGLELWRSGELVWHETIDSIDLEGRVIDAFFLPVDRRAALGSAMPVGGTRDQELPASCALRVEIAKGMAWGDVPAGYTRLREEWNERLRDRALGVDRNATVELGPQGQPIAWIVRLDSVPEQPPSGFTAVAARRGVALAVRGLESVTPEKLAALSKSLPVGSAPGTAYVRFESKDGAPESVLIVLPYSAAKGG